MNMYKGIERDRRSYADLMRQCMFYTMKEAREIIPECSSCFGYGVYLEDKRYKWCEHYFPLSELRKYERGNKG